MSFMMMVMMYLNGRSLPQREGGLLLRLVPRCSTQVKGLLRTSARDECAPGRTS